MICCVHALYTLAILVLAVVLSPWFLYQAIRYRKYFGNLAQRMGHLPVSFNLDGDESIWIHAVSVGEALTARALVADLRERYPGLQDLPVHDDADRAADRAVAVPGRRRGVLLAVRPAAVRQSDAAPGQAAALHHDGDRNLAEPAARLPAAGREDDAGERPHLVAVVSRGTGWRARFFRRVLADVDRFCMQSDESARRIIDIGADPSRVIVTGSLKFESLESPARGGRARRRARAAVLPHPAVAAGVHGGQHAEGRGGRRVVARSPPCGARHPTALLVMAPRKPERFGEAEALARAEGLRVVRRTELPVDAEPRADVVDSRHDRRTRASVPGGDRRLRRRQPGRPGRAQHPRAGRARQADRVRAAHGELRGDRRRIPATAGAPCRCLAQRNWRRRSCGWSGDPVERARLGAAARALVEANRGAKPRTLAAIEALLPPPGARGVVRPFRR